MRAPSSLRVMGSRGSSLWDSSRLWEQPPWPYAGRADVYGPYRGSAAAAMYASRYDEALQGHRFFSVAPP